MRVAGDRKGGREREKKKEGGESKKERYIEGRNNREGAKTRA